jgi:hypothetical protein
MTPTLLFHWMNINLRKRNRERLSCMEEPGMELGFHERLFTRRAVTTDELYHRSLAALRLSWETLASGTTRQSGHQLQKKGIDAHWRTKHGT